MRPGLWGRRAGVVVGLASCLIAAGCASQRAVSAVDGADGAPSDGASGDSQWAAWSWQRASVVPQSPPSESALVSDVARGPAGLVAVGYAFTPDPGFERRAAVWKSADGRSWRRVADQAAFADASMDGIALGPGGRLVAVGSRGPIAEPTAAAWVSDDGERWEAANLEHESAAAGALGDVAAVSGAGFVAVGALGIAAEVATAAVWVSSNGASWQPVAQSGLPEKTIPDSVESTTKGVLLLGRSCPGTPPRWDECAGEIWSTTDGRAWRLVHRFPPAVIIGGIAESASGLVAVRHQPPEVWTSDEGGNWSRAAADEQAFAADPDRDETYLAGVFARGAVVVAAGGMDRRPKPDEAFPGCQYSGYAAVWRSADGGRAWERVAHDAAFASAEEPRIWIERFIEWGSTLVAIGGACVGMLPDQRTDWAPAFWTASPFP